MEVFNGGEGGNVVTIAFDMQEGGGGDSTQYHAFVS